MAALTAERRQELIHRSFFIRTVYTGKIWGGVQITDSSLRHPEDHPLYEGVEDMELLTLDEAVEYEGLYSSTVDDELAIIEQDGYLSDRELTALARIREAGI